MGSQVTHFWGIHFLNLMLDSARQGTCTLQRPGSEEKSNWKERAVEVLQSDASFLLVNHGILVWNVLEFSAIKAIIYICTYYSF